MRPKSGYSTFWVNDVPGGNGLEQLPRAGGDDPNSARSRCAGPVDRWTPTDIAREIERLRLDPERLALGIGSGAIKSGGSPRHPRPVASSVTVVLRECRLAHSGRPCASSRDEMRTA